MTRNGRLSPQAWALGAITLAGGVARFATLHVQSFWLDETVTARLVSKSLTGMLSALPKSESTPPLYYLLAWCSGHIFGVGEVSLRLPSAAAGTLLIPVVYLLVTELADSRAGLIASALTAANPFLFWYSQEARAYELFVLFAVVSLLATARRSWWLWAVSAVLAFATHYFAIFVVVPEAAWLYLQTPPERRPRVPLLVVAASGLALLPLAISQASDSRAKFITETSLATRIVQVPKQFLIGYGDPLGTGVSVLLLVLGGVGLVLAFTSPRPAGRALVGAAAVVVLVPLLIALPGADYFLARNVIAGVVPCVAAVAIGYSGSRAGLLAAAATIAISVGTVAAVLGSSRYQRDDWRGAAKALGPSNVPRAVVLTPTAGVGPFTYYAPSVHALRTQQFVRVREVDVLGVAERGQRNLLKGLGPQPLPPPAGFTLTRTVRKRQLALFEYRSPVTRMVFLPELEAHRVGNTLAAVLVSG
jgi:mannosyltransferase